MGGSQAQQNHIGGMNDPELFPQPGKTGFHFSGVRRAVAGGAALYDIGDIDILAFNSGGFQNGIQKLTRFADKRTTEFILRLPGTFADKYHRGEGVPLSKNDAPAALAQITVLAL